MAGRTDLCGTCKWFDGDDLRIYSQVSLVHERLNKPELASRRDPDEVIGWCHFNTAPEQGETTNNGWCHNHEVEV